MVFVFYLYSSLSKEYIACKAMKRPIKNPVQTNYHL